MSHQRYSTFEEGLSPDGRKFALVRSGPQHAVTCLNKILQAHHNVQELMLQQIDLTPALIHLLAALGHDRKWTSWKFVDCRRVVEIDQDQSQSQQTKDDQAALNRLAQSNVLSLILQTTMAFSPQRKHFMNLEVFLSKNSTIRKLRIMYQRFSEYDARELAAGLHLSRTLNHLCLSGTKKLAREMPILVVGVRNNFSLRSFDIGDCSLNDTIMTELIEGIRSHPRLEELNLSNNSCGSNGLNKLSQWLLRSDCLLRSIDLKMQRGSRLNLVESNFSEALKHNKSLRTLVLSNTGLLDEDVISLIDALVKNATLKELNLSDNRRVSDPALLHLASNLPKLSLRVLNLRKLENRGSLEVMKALSIGFCQNYELEWLKIHYWRHVQFTRLILFYANANRGGRRALQAKSQIPLPLWPKILERAQTVSYFLPIQQDAEANNLYHMIRNSPQLWESF